MKSDFKPGMVVILKCGSQAMLVTGKTDEFLPIDKVTCVWMKGIGDIERDTFHASELMIAEEDKAWRENREIEALQREMNLIGLRDKIKQMRQQLTDIMPARQKIRLAR